MVTSPTIDQQINPTMRKVMEGVKTYVEQSHPIFTTLGFDVTEIGFGHVSVNLTVNDTYVEEGVVHGGIFTIILDTLMGQAVYTRLDKMKPVATINLKSDFPGTVKSGANITCTSHCDAITDDVAYCRGQAINKDTGDLIAITEATFMVGTRSKRRESRL